MSGQTECQGRRQEKRNSRGSMKRHGPALPSPCMLRHLSPCAPSLIRASAPHGSLPISPPVFCSHKNSRYVKKESSRNVGANWAHGWCRAAGSPRIYHPHHRAGWTPVFSVRGVSPPAPPHEEKPAQALRASPRGSSSRALVGANRVSRTAPATRCVRINGTVPAAQIYAQGHGTCRSLLLFSFTAAVTSLQRASRRPSKGRMNLVCTLVPLVSSLPSGP